MSDTLTDNAGDNAAETELPYDWITPPEPKPTVPQSVAVECEDGTILTAAIIAGVRLRQTGGTPCRWALEVQNGVTGEWLTQYSTLDAEKAYAQKAEMVGYLFDAIIEPPAPDPQPEVPGYQEQAPILNLEEWPAGVPMPPSPYGRREHSFRPLPPPREAPPDDWATLNTRQGGGIPLGAPVGTVMPRDVAAQHSGPVQPKVEVGGVPTKESLAVAQAHMAAQYRRARGLSTDPQEVAKELGVAPAA